MYLMSRLIYYSAKTYKQKRLSKATLKREALQVRRKFFDPKSAETANKSIKPPLFSLEFWQASIRCVAHRPAMVIHHRNYRVLRRQNGRCHRATVLPHRNHLPRRRVVYAALYRCSSRSLESLASSKHRNA